MDTELGYIEVGNLLNKEYGDSNLLSIMYLKPIQDWPVLKGDDNIGITLLS